MDYASWLVQAVNILRDSASESPKRDAEILLQSVTGRSRAQIIAFAETPLNPAQQAELATLLARRQKGEPIAYLIGEREFWSLALQVSPATLIPRPDTERLVELALGQLDQHRLVSVLDLGCGSGAIALAIATERPQSQIVAVDVNPEAVALAQQNAQRLGVTNVSFRQSDWYSMLAKQRFDMIVSNPPYIAVDDPHLQQGDVRFEPKRALVAGEGGLADLRYIVEHAKYFLRSPGVILLEHGWQQGEAVRHLLAQHDFVNVTTEADLGGNDRVTMGHYLLEQA